MPSIRSIHQTRSIRHLSPSGQSLMVVRSCAGPKGDSGSERHKYTTRSPPPYCWHRPVLSGPSNWLLRTWASMTRRRVRWLKWRRDGRVLSLRTKP
ncbi:hypothetical protein CGRA01v4_05534 [Colletotrichum graminicola]|nr:hypothetical protein CGRA01v4_05534 [Colletotrichum graminicola]